MCFIWSQTVQTTAFVLDTDNMEALEPLKGSLHKMTFSWNLGASWFLFWIDLLFQECVFFSLSTFMVNPWPLASHWGDSEKFPRKQILGSVGAAWAEFHGAGNFWTRKNPFVFFISKWFISRNPLSGIYWNFVIRKRMNLEFGRIFDLREYWSSSAFDSQKYSPNFVIAQDFIKI